MGLKSVHFVMEFVLQMRSQDKATTSKQKIYYENDPVFITTVRLRQVLFYMYLYLSFAYTYVGVQTVAAEQCLQFLPLICDSVFTIRKFRWFDSVTLKCLTGKSN